MLDDGRCMVRALEEIFVDIEKNINSEDGLDVDMTLPQEEECRTVGRHPTIIRASGMIDSLLCIELCVCTWRMWKVPATVPILVAT